MISYTEAYQLTLESISPLEIEQVELIQAANRVPGKDLYSRIWSPSLDVSLKDGYAVLSEDVKDAQPGHPATLELVGSVAAGGGWDGEIVSGQTVRILSGAPVPAGAHAVLAEEFTEVNDNLVKMFNNAEPGRNILLRGNDVKEGEKIIQAGSLLNPPILGHLASAGFNLIPVFRNPRVAIVATGDEVIAPGKKHEDGKLYASNLVTLAAWCTKYGFTVDIRVVIDQENLIRETLKELLEKNDAVITSGGAWKGERDLVVRVLDSLNWEKKYHYVRMGPGKAIGFGMVEQKPVFCLPGGPPSNHIAFLQIALPGLLKLAGRNNPELPRTTVELAETIRGQIDWTQFVHGNLIPGDGIIKFAPAKLKSRLQMMATSDAIVKIPEGIDCIPVGTLESAYLLN